MLRYFISKGRPAGYQYGNVNESLREHTRPHLYAAGFSGGSRPQRILLGDSTLAESFRHYRLLGPPGGYQYLYAISTWICGFRVIHMDMWALPAVLPRRDCQHDPLCTDMVYIPAGLRPSLHTGTRFVKQNPQNTPAK